MSLSTSLSFTNAIAGSTVRVAELFEITLQNGQTFYYTSHSKNIIWGNPSQTYTAISISRSSINTKINLEAQTTEIKLGNISGDLFDLAEKNVLDAVSITIKRINWDTVYGDSMEIIVFVGQANVKFDRIFLTLDCKSIISRLNMRIPKDIYQESCNKTLYDDGCNLVRTNFPYSGGATSDGPDNFTLRDWTITAFRVAFDNGDSSNPIEIGDFITGSISGDGVCANIVYLTASTGIIYYVRITSQYVNDEVITGGGNTVTVNGTPVQDTTLYEMGELEMTSGNNSGYRRMVRSHGSSFAVVAIAFPNIIETGDDYKIYPGCDKTSDDCQNKFDNEQSFAGFLFVPKIEEVVF